MSFPVAWICSQSHLCQKHYSSCLSSYKKKKKSSWIQLDSEKSQSQPFVLATEPIKHESGAQVARARVPIRRRPHEKKRPMRKQTGVRHRASWNLQGFLAENEQKLLYRDVQSVSRIAVAALRHSIALSLPFSHCASLYESPHKGAYCCVAALVTVL